jgi:SHS2 domain-containing protein
MGTLETFDHTADVGFRIEADDLDDLFRTAAGGLLDYIVTNRDAVRPIERQEFELAADSPGDLLIAWLNELIFRVETQHRLFAAFEVSVRGDASGCRLRAVVAGEPIDRARHVLDHEVKAVTRHGATLEQRDGRWHATVILDI